MYLIFLRARQLSDSEEEDSTFSLSTPAKTRKLAANDSVDQTGQISPPAKQTPPQSEASGSWYDKVND